MSKYCGIQELQLPYLGVARPTDCYIGKGSVDKSIRMEQGVTPSVTPLQDKVHEYNYVCASLACYGYFKVNTELSGSNLITPFIISLPLLQNESLLYAQHN